jgi:uncharacterized protein (DUF885 family)
MRKLLPLVLLAAPCCITSSPGPSPTWVDPAGGVENHVVAELCRTAWENRLRLDPVFASRQNDPRYHGLLPDHSGSGVKAHIRDQSDLLSLVAALDRSQMSPSEAEICARLAEQLADEIAVLSLGLHEWVVDPLEGPQNAFLTLAADQPIETSRERDQLVLRWHAMARSVRDQTDNVLRGRRSGRVASVTSIDKVIGQLDALLATAPMDSPLVVPALGGGEWVPLNRGETVSAVAHKHLGDSRHQKELRAVNLHLQEGDALALGTRVLLPAPDDVLSPEERGRFLHDVLNIVEDEIYPAFARYREILAGEIRPNARADDRPGLTSLPDGSQSYRTLVRSHTSLDLSPTEIHEFGLEEVERIRSEMAQLGARLFDTRDVRAIQARLRNDPAMHFTTREEVEAKASSALDLARGAIPAWFGRLPHADCEVVPVPAHEEADTTVAYYREPAADGSRPGRYYINTSQPETRTRYEAEVLAYHEALPGHHLQIAIAQELEDLPLFARHATSTAFVEGWALYTERLSDEMGLYGGDLDRLGMLSYDAWRACRLVVDTGLHAFGWSRTQAIEYMVENTLLARNNIENEVDRYIAWPGQALAYKLGQREILALRAEAEEAFGSAFDIRAFHDHVLENGAVSLASLRRHIETWIAEGSPRGDA